MLKKEDGEFELGEGASLSGLLDRLAGTCGEAFRK